MLLGASMALNAVFGYLLFRTSPVIRGTALVPLLTLPVTISGNKEVKSFSLPLSPRVLADKDTLSMTFDLKGLCLLPADASTIQFSTADGNKYAVSLADYATNCAFGEQTVSISTGDFFTRGNPAESSELQMQFWYPAQFAIDIKNITLYNRVLGVSTVKIKPTQVPRGGFSRYLRPKVTITPTAVPELASVSATPVFALGSTVSPNPLSASPTRAPSITSIPSPTRIPTLTPTASPIPANASWGIQSVSSMKETKDRICNQRDAAFIAKWVEAARELGVTHIAVETPYDNPACGSAVAYAKAWVDAIHSRGLKVWHRHMPLAFEGIYDVAKNASINYFPIMSAYITANPTFFREGDIFTPVPEPQNGGISGITYCPNNVCIFTGASHFNSWLRDAMTVSEAAFDFIGLGGKVKVGYYGFDGFVAWGDNNPDWHGILEDATIAKMGNITIDHYPEIVGDTMDNDLNELSAKYPNTPIVIGEWGTITGGDTEAQITASLQAAKRPNVIGFNYWHMGVGGNEGLINEDFSKNKQYDELQGFFK
jgi:hypothetical protein